MTIRGIGRTLIEGDAALVAKFDALSGKDARRIARQALNAGAREMRDEIKFQVPTAKTRGHSSRGLKASIKSRLRKSRRSGVLEAIAGIGVGKQKKAATASGPQARKFSAGAPHFHLVALGTRARWTGGRTRRTKSGVAKKPTGGGARSYRGRMPADNFVGRAYAARGPKAIALMVDVMKAGIEAAAGSAGTR